MAASITLRLPPLPPHFHGFQTPFRSNSMLYQIRKSRNPHYEFSISASASSSSSSSSSEREEQRWLREEQRWLREEQRWLREESRWNSERQSLLQEIAALKLRIQALERENSSSSLSSSSSTSDVVSTLASMLQALKDSESKLKSTLEMSQIAESGTGPRPMLLEEGEVKEMIVEEIRVSEGQGEVKKKEKEYEKEKKKKVALRKGSEGEDVRAMQEALQKLGFYSGEEDMEYSSFSSGTERAVKTWQASLGTREDGIMTAELLERLFLEMGMVNTDVLINVDQKGDSASLQGKDGPNGAVVRSVTEMSEIQQTVVKENGVTGVEVSQHRVFLLGENRWEEPSRLVGKDKNVSGSKAVAATKCITCRGEGRLMCTECDGTGEPNVEPQFLEWVDEGAKCPYCEGLGYTVCDVCEGRATA